MIYLEDLVKAKSENEKTIEENNDFIFEKQKENIELEAENRVLNKLIDIENAKNVDQTCQETEQEVVEQQDESY